MASVESLKDHFAKVVAHKAALRGVAPALPSAMVAEMEALL